MKLRTKNGNYVLTRTSITTIFGIKYYILEKIPNSINFYDCFQ